MISAFFYSLLFVVLAALPFAAVPEEDRPHQEEEEVNADLPHAAGFPEVDRPHEGGEEEISENLWDPDSVFAELPCAEPEFPEVGRSPKEEEATGESLWNPNEISARLLDQDDQKVNVWHDFESPSQVHTVEGKGKEAVSFDLPPTSDPDPFPDTQIANMPCHDFQAQAPSQLHTVKGKEAIRLDLPLNSDLAKFQAPPPQLITFKEKQVVAPGLPLIPAAVGGSSGGGNQNPLNLLVSGLRFSPNDYELVTFFLTRKILGLQLPTDIIQEIDVYNYHPSQLGIYDFKHSLPGEAFFFTSKEGKDSNKSLSKPATSNGYWKDTGVDMIIHKNRCVGYKTTMVFYQAGAPTPWIMHELRVNPSSFPGRDRDQAIKSKMKNYVACRIRNTEHNYDSWK